MNIAEYKQTNFATICGVVESVTNINDNTVFKLRTRVIKRDELTYSFKYFDAILNVAFWTKLYAAKYGEKDFTGKAVMIFGGVGIGKITSQYWETCIKGMEISKTEDVSDEFAVKINRWHVDGEIVDLKDMKYSKIATVKNTSFSYTKDKGRHTHSVEVSIDIPNSLAKNLGSDFCVGSFCSMVGHVKPYVNKNGQDRAMFCADGCVLSCGAANNPNPVDDIPL